MTSLDERLRDLPPERYARGARAAADLAIRAAELVGREPPADAVWLSNQTDEQLREQQQHRLHAAAVASAAVSSSADEQRERETVDLVTLVGTLAEEHMRSGAVLASYQVVPGVGSVGIKGTGGDLDQLKEKWANISRGDSLKAGAEVMVPKDGTDASAGQRGAERRQA